MSNEVLGDDDIVRDFEDDVIELTTIEEENDSVCVEKEKKSHKRRKTSAVWIILMPFMVRRVRS
jgi:hypothetical protein